jgi:predicted nicotinamide N-methyase
MSKPAATTPDTIEIRELPPPTPCQPDGLPPIPGGWTEREWIIQGQSFRLTLPAVPDSFLEEPEVREAFERDEYMPYWAYLWPAALKMAATILKSGWPARADVLEIGAGIGIVGLAGLSRGLNVTISDYEPKAVDLAIYNARQNGLMHGQGMVLDWRSPPQRKYTFLWGSDLLYEERHHQPLIELTKQVLAEDGMAWFADGGRIPAGRFCRLLDQQGLTCDLFDEHHRPLAAPHVGQYQLIEVRQRKSLKSG